MLLFLHVMLESCDLWLPKAHIVLMVLAVKNSQLKMAFCDCSKEWGDLSRVSVSSNPCGFRSIWCIRHVTLTYMWCVSGSLYMSRLDIRWQSQNHFLCCTWHDVFMTPVMQLVPAQDFFLWGPILVFFLILDHMDMATDALFLGTAVACSDQISSAYQQLGCHFGHRAVRTTIHTETSSIQRVAFL